LLAEDSEKIECLLPHRSVSRMDDIERRWLDGSLRTSRSRLPFSEDRWAHITAPVGNQTLYALLSEKPLASASELHQQLLAGTGSPQRSRSSGCYGISSARITANGTLSAIATGYRAEQFSQFSFLSCLLVSMRQTRLRLSLLRSRTNFCRFKAISSRMGLRRRAVVETVRSQRPVCRLILSIARVRLIL